jgi:hypothetical protein
LGCAWFVSPSQGGEAIKKEKPTAADVLRLAGEALRLIVTVLALLRFLHWL